MKMIKSMTVGLAFAMLPASPARAGIALTSRSATQMPPCQRDRAG